MSKRGIGVCTECGTKTEITFVDDANWLCDDCLEELEYVLCDECQDYWLSSAISIYHLKDGRTLCMYCAEDLLYDEISEDDIDYIDEV